MTASVRILTTSSVDSAPAILLVAPDGSKTLVNCGEGCQRSFLESSQRLSKVRTVCLTHIAHESIGGLPGMILTSADSSAAATAAQIVASSSQTADPTNTSSGKQPHGQADGCDDTNVVGLDLVGPVGTRAFVHSLRHFMRREKFPVRVQEGVVRDSKCQTSAATSNKKKKKSKKSDPMFEFSVESVAFTMTHVPHPSPETSTSSGTKRPRLDEPVQRQVLSFIFTSAPLPGKFLTEKASELGIPKGPLFAKLKAGQSVTFVNVHGVEQTIESHQVVTPPTPGVGVLILYYPTLDIGKQIFSSGRFCEVVESTVVCVDVVLHMAPESVFAELSPMHWTHDRGSNDSSPIEHVLLATADDGTVPDIDGTPFRSAALGAKSRSLLCGSIYRTPTSSGDTPGPLEHVLARRGRSGMDFVLVPRAKKGYQSNAPYLDNMEQETLDLIEKSGASSLATKLLTECDFTTDAVVAEGELFFTGTGSAVPCKHRNVSGMMLKGSCGNAILLDVGEGTVGQLLRSEPDVKANRSLEFVVAVWISHPHADHHLGILRLLHERKASKPLILIAPTPLFRFLDEYSLLEPSIKGTYTQWDCRDLVQKNQPFLESLQQVLGFSGCTAVPVTHCAHAYAVVLDGTSFGRVVYSGDCRPSHQLAVAGHGADLLIHEATFEDGMEAEAVLKRHSTVGEAIRVAHEMQAKCIVLTHFSQRYPKIPPTPAQEHGALPIIFAFDYMRLTPSNLRVASVLTPALRLLYPEDDSEPDTEQTTSNAAAAMAVPGLFAHNDLL